MTVRISEDQSKLLFGRKEPTKVNPRRSKSQRATQPENVSEKEILDYLAIKGWLAKRNQVGTYVPYWAAMKGGPVNHSNVVRIGEKGEADWTLTRPRGPAVEMFHLEVKAPGQTPSDDQLRWGRNRKALGYQWTWADSLDMFLAWYAPIYGK